MDTLIWWVAASMHGYVCMRQATEVIVTICVLCLVWAGCPVTGKTLHRYGNKRKKAE